jgi:hypothetical protein
MSPVCLDPFALCRPFSGALGGRDATDSYGSAVPVWHWGPVHLPWSGRHSRFRRCSHSTFSVSRRYPSVTLMPDESGREARLLDEWSSRLPHASYITAAVGSEHLETSVLVCFHHPMSHLFIGRVRWASPQIAHRRVVRWVRLGYSGLPITGLP